jgi:predicted enzyme related to lactoylglutathione lyase
MIHGAHTILYAKDADAARAFFRDVLGYASVDAGQGWLIFALPPGEIGIHPAEGNEHGRHELYFMCDDVDATRRDLERRGVRFTAPVSDYGWGIMTRFEIPGGGEIGLYQPRHETAITPLGVPRKPAAKRSRGTRSRPASRASKPSARGKASARGAASRGSKGGRKGAAARKRAKR